MVNSSPTFLAVGHRAHPTGSPSTKLTMVVSMGGTQFPILVAFCLLGTKNREPAALLPLLLLIFLVGQALSQWGLDSRYSQ